MTDMIERVARAIRFFDDWPTLSETAKAIYREQARFAIEAMREPTEAMEKAGNAPWRDADAEMCWRLMIDAALGEKP